MINKLDLVEYMELYTHQMRNINALQVFRDTKEGSKWLKESVS